MDTVSQRTTIGASETLLPGVKLSAPLLASTFLVVVGLVVPLRAVSHGLMTRRAAAQRVVILGTGPLACKIVEEIERAPRLPYSVVGMMDDGGPAAAPPWLSGALHPLPVRALEDMERLIGQLHKPILLVEALGLFIDRLHCGGISPHLFGGGKTAYERVE